LILITAVTTAATNLRAVDVLEREVCEAEDDIRSPDRQFGDGISLATDCQVVQSSHARERVELTKCPDVCRRKDQRLWEHKRTTIGCYVSSVVVKDLGIGIVGFNVPIDTL